jgi:hypothetical protein
VRVWLDDIRPKPSWADVHVTTAEEAVKVLSTGKVTEMSFDHDLAWALGNNLSTEEIPSEQTEYTVACWVERAAYLGEIPQFKWHVHSANPTGAWKIKSALERADSYWRKKDQ